MCGLNARPTDYKSVALPTAPTRHGRGDRSRTCLGQFPKLVGDRCPTPRYKNDTKINLAVQTHLTTSYRLFSILDVTPICRIGAPPLVAVKSATVNGRSVSPFPVRPFGIRWAGGVPTARGIVPVTPLCASKRCVSKRYALCYISFNAISNIQQSSHCHFSSRLLLPSFRSRTGDGALCLPAEPAERDIITSVR